MADKTWKDDLQPFITGEVPRDAQVDDDVYVRRVNMAIGLINSRSGGFDDRWVNDGAAGSLTLSGAECTFPGDLLDPETVLWNGVQLHFRSPAQLNALDPLWRSRSGTPSLFTLTGRGLVLDCNPGDDTGSDLEIWGRGCIPELEFEPDSLNPFAYLPSSQQMAPALYVLGYLPLYGRSREDVIAIQGDYRTQWEAFLAGVEWSVIQRRYPKISS